jgi:hypothetical protein
MPSVPRWSCLRFPLKPRSRCRGLGGTRAPVDPDRVRADDQKPDASGVQRGKQIEEVFVHDVRAPLLRILLRSIPTRRELVDRPGSRAKTPRPPPPSPTGLHCETPAPSSLGGPCDALLRGRAFPTVYPLVQSGTSSRDKAGALSSRTGRARAGSCRLRARLKRRRVRKQHIIPGQEQRNRLRAVAKRVRAGFDRPRITASHCVTTLPRARITRRRFHDRPARDNDLSGLHIDRAARFHQFVTTAETARKRHNHGQSAIVSGAQTERALVFERGDVRIRTPRKP